MYIQYAGFSIVASSRVYNFDVIDPPAASREFTVKVLSEAFRAGSLSYQDGPGICFAHLQRELDGETPDSHAEAHLRIGEQEIREYRTLHYPRKKTYGRDAIRNENLS
ncbi:MAG: hypothetical protein LAN62_12810 [Acidobacteriia bacterium]|nr:hypothetical protein [Terriglobia bacterium]